MAGFRHVDLGLPVDAPTVAFSVPPPLAAMGGSSSRMRPPTAGRPQFLRPSEDPAKFLRQRESCPGVSTGCGLARHMYRSDPWPFYAAPISRTRPNTP